MKKKSHSPKLYITAFLLALGILSCNELAQNDGHGNVALPDTTSKIPIDAKALQNSGNLEAAIDAYTSELEIEPNDVAALGNRAMLLAASGKNQAALQDYDQLIEIDPGNYTAHEKRADLLFQMQKFEAALRAYQLLITHRKGSAALFNSRGMIHLKLANPMLAKLDFDSALLYQPNWQTALANRGTANYELANYPAAENDFLKCGNSSPSAINGRGLITQFVKNQPLEAEKLYVEASVIFPEDPAAWFNLAYLRAADRQTREAIRLFSKALAVDSTYAEAAANRGLLYMQLKEPQNALPDFENAARINPRNSRYILLKGWAKCENGAWLKGCLDLSAAKDGGEKDAQELIERYCK